MSAPCHQLAVKLLYNSALLIQEEEKISYQPNNIMEGLYCLNL